MTRSSRTSTDRTVNWSLGTSGRPLVARECLIASVARTISAAPSAARGMSTALRTASVSAMPWNVALGAVLTAGAITEMIADGVRSPVVFGAGVLAAAALILRGRWPFGAALVSLGAFALPGVVVAESASDPRGRADVGVSGAGLARERVHDGDAA